MQHRLSGSLFSAAVLLKYKENIRELYINFLKYALLLPPKGYRYEIYKFQMSGTLVSTLLKRIGNLQKALLVCVIRSVRN